MSESVSGSHKHVWLCIEDRNDGSLQIHGDTGRGGWSEPFLPELCQFGGWQNHYKYCDWYVLDESSLPKKWRTR